MNIKDPKIQRMSEVFKTLGHPVRLMMVKGLMTNQCSVGDIVTKTGLPQSTVSQHLSLLKRVGILTPVKDGVRTCYRVTDDTVKAIVNGIR